MREITKTLTIPADGKSMEFRLTKLDAFSGASLLRMLSRIPAGLRLCRDAAFRFLRNGGRNQPIRLAGDAYLYAVCAGRRGENER